ncbi:MAG: hypothetical protein AAGI23_19415 [Bacteroidota bacterium]
MKYTFIIIISFVVFSCQTPTSETSNELTAEEEQTAKALIQGAFDDLWGGVDSTKISQYHTDDFIILENGEVWDNDRIKEYMRGQLQNPNRPKRINKMDYIAIDKYGDVINIAYYNYAEFMQADSLVGEASWLESAIAIPTEDGWRLKMMHSTRMRR